MLSGLVMVSIIGGVCVIGLPFDRLYGRERGEEIAKEVGVLVSLIVFVNSLQLWVGFDKMNEVKGVLSESVGGFQYVERWMWMEGREVVFGIDGISLLFVLLTTFLMPICMIGVWEGYSREYMGLFLVMEGMILVVFTVLDLIVFYVFFEGVLIPMFFIIGVWGSRERKVRAGYYFFLYTLLGSLFMLLCILLLYWEQGTTDFEGLIIGGVKENRQYLLWLGFFLSFAVKVPMVPVHLWLPEAHVEAPTGGSVILAGILLKLGTYGIIRYSLPLFPIGTMYFTPLVYVMSMVGIVYASLTAIRQTDMKRIIAYASVAHMNMTLVGLFSGTVSGYEGAILQMLSHGFVSGALFICVGVLYDRYGSRLVKYFSGIVHTMPIFSVVFMVFTLANIGLPGTSSFVGEFMILLGVYQVNKFVAVISGTSMVLGGGYGLWLYNRVVFGNVNLKIGLDLRRREYYMLMPLVIMTIIMGINPGVFLEVL